MGDLPEAVELTRFDKNIREKMHQIRASFRLGKLSPEARNFLAVKIEKLLAGRIKEGTGRLVVNKEKKLEKFPLEKTGFLKEEFPEMFK